MAEAVACAELPELTVSVLLERRFSLVAGGTAAEFEAFKTYFSTALAKGLSTSVAGRPTLLGSQVVVAAVVAEGMRTAVHFYISRHASNPSTMTVLRWLDFSFSDEYERLVLIRSSWAVSGSTERLQVRRPSPPSCSCRIPERF